MGEQAERLAAALVVLAEHGIPADVQELLVGGDPARGVPPGALAKVLAAATRDCAAIVRGMMGEGR